MFSNIVATGEYTWAPSSGVLCDDNVGIDEDPNTNEEQPDLEEGSGDSKEDGIPNFTDDVCNMVRGVNMSSSSNTRSSGKRKEREYRKRCSIPEVMSELHSIEGVNIGDDFHGFATEFLGLRRNREIWSTMDRVVDHINYHDGDHNGGSRGDDDDRENDDDDNDDDSDEDDESFWR
ncbi:uncharacterized protein LOC127905672 [Populus trichocarpa]|uniref:uncharacterized protein LOC127905672 n=1 Tax=Populus trichocarpa TaxID=3694 RepID=UPI002277F04B|nr:uncharacterized protein LOC127905672 [Populus trichocarpa]